MRGFIDLQMRYSDVVAVGAADIKEIVIGEVVVTTIEGVVVAGVDVVVVDIAAVAAMEEDIKVIGKITTLMTTASSSKKMESRGDWWAGIGSRREMRGEEGSEGSEGREGGEGGVCKISHIGFKRERDVGL
jgi:hypothetical protein